MYLPRRLGPLLTGRPLFVGRSTPKSKAMNNSIFIALPAFGQMNCSRTTFSLMALAKALLKSNTDYYFSDNSFPDIAESRNMLTTIWYDRTQSEHMLFIDADMDFEPQLVMDMLAFDKPLVGCLYPKRTYPLSFVGRPTAGEQVTDKGFLKVEGIGFGVTLIRRDCIEAMLNSGNATSDNRLANHAAGAMLKGLGIHRLIRAFDRIEVETGYLSEDMAFCKRHRDSGGEVWASVGHKITHIGPHGYSGCYAEAVATAPQYGAWTAQAAA